jgi:hypothetical protein
MAGICQLDAFAANSDSGYCDETPVQDIHADCPELLPEL